MKRSYAPWVLCAAVLVAACKDQPPAAPAAPEPVLQGSQLRFPEGHPQLAQLGIAQATPARSVVVDLPARFVWNEDHTQRIYPAFAGRVERITADVGQAVRPGTALAYVASPDFGIAQAETAKAQVDARHTQKILQRQRELFEAGVIARKDLEQAEAEAARAGAEVQRAEARTRLYGAGGTGAIDQRLALTSGIAGIVVERNLTPAQELRPDQSGNGVPPLFVVSDPSSLWVVIDAREADIDALRPGASFELSVPVLPGQTFNGRVTAVGDAIDPSTRTVRVRGVVDNATRRLKAEMLATARVQRQVPEGVMVPASAVQLDGTRHRVMVQVGPGTFEVRDVEVSQLGPAGTLISAGLKAGEKVVTDNMLLLARQYGLAQEAARNGTPK